LISSNETVGFRGYWVNDQKKQILILQQDPNFADSLETACVPLGDTVSFQNTAEAMEAISLRNFDLVLLQWELFSDEGSLDFRTLCQLQPLSLKMALFKTPELTSAVLAMKMGFTDIIWFQMDPASLVQKIQDSLTRNQVKKPIHTHLSPLMESLVRRSLDQKATLFQARRQFYRMFLNKVLDNTDLNRQELATLLEVSPRTLHRYITNHGALKTSIAPKNP